MVRAQSRAPRRTRASSTAGLSAGQALPGSSPRSTSSTGFSGRAMAIFTPTSMGKMGRTVRSSSRRSHSRCPRRRHIWRARSASPSAVATMDIPASGASPYPYPPRIVTFTTPGVFSRIPLRSTSVCCGG